MYSIGVSFAKMKRYKTNCFLTRSFTDPNNPHTKSYRNKINVENEEDHIDRMFDENLFLQTEGLLNQN